MSKYVFGPVFVATIGAALAGFHIGLVSSLSSFFRLALPLTFRTV